MTRRILGLLLFASAAGADPGGWCRRSPPSRPTRRASPRRSRRLPRHRAGAPGEPAPAPAASPAPAAHAGCRAAGYAPYGGQPLQIRRIGQYGASGITTPARLIIRDDSSYARFWASLGAGDRPSVDFSRDIVIAVAAGQRATGGNAIAVERVTRTGDGLAVEVVETSPARAA